MKYYSFLLFFVSVQLYSQSDQLNYLKDVDNSPVLQWCQSGQNHDKQCFLNTLNEYVSERVILPFDENKNPVEGKVKVFLIFDKSGKLIVKAIRTSNKTLKESAATVFRDFAHFTPAVKDGKNVSMFMIYPINYTFSAGPDTVYSIDEVTLPQLKKYKKHKTPEEIKKLNHHYIFSQFLKSQKLKGHLIDLNTCEYKFSFEIDSTGSICNFVDLVVPGSDDEKYLNKKATKRKGFSIPPKIGSIPVTVRDTIEFVTKNIAIHRTETRLREVIKEYE
jgi:hypothetical protein